jgi:hypothetical protein
VKEGYLQRYVDFCPEDEAKKEEEMKKLLLCVLILFVVSGVAWAQEKEKKEEKNARGSVSFVLVNSYAPIGVGAEFFLGNFGLGATLTTLFFAAEGEAVFVLEPGVYGRFYFSDLSSTFFISTGVSYLTAVGTYGGGVDVLDFGLVKVNVGLGYNAIFGKKENARFSLELGPRYRKITDPDNDVAFPLLIHFMLLFGTVF